MAVPPVTHSTIFARLYAWLGARTFYHWPSLVTEFVGGLLLTALLLAVILLLYGWLALLVLATVASVLYEAKLDPAGWSWRDVLEREAGVVVAAVAVHLLGGL